MALDPNKWTTKTQQAVAAALETARANANPELTPDHLLAALLRQDDSIVLPVLQKLGLAPLMVNQIFDKLSQNAAGGRDPMVGWLAFCLFDGGCDAPLG